MGLISDLKQKKRRGGRYDGPAAYCDDYQIVRRPGFYALTPDGKSVRPDVPLVCVDDAPGDPEDGSCHFEYAVWTDPPQRGVDGSKIERRGATVELEAEPIVGKGGIQA